VAEARKEFERLFKEKTRKGYVHAPEGKPLMVVRAQEQNDAAKTKRKTTKKKKTKVTKRTKKSTK
jgi:hypothetical protein